MTAEKILKELANKGYDAKVVTVLKNGVELEAVLINPNDSNISPIIYLDAVMDADAENVSLSDAVEKIVSLYEENKNPKIDINEMFNYDFLAAHLYVGLQKKSTEKMIKRDVWLDGLESYLYIRCNDRDRIYTVKLVSSILEQAGMTEETAWELAESNTMNEIEIGSLAKTMAEINGIECTSCTSKLEDMMPFYCISNTSKMRGASAILNKEALKVLGHELNVDTFIVFPSSIHEMLLWPCYNNEYNDMDILNNMADMVKEINETSVLPEERLTDRVYVVRV